jgi:hypothetical protein
MKFLTAADLMDPKIQELFDEKMDEGTLRSEEASSSVQSELVQKFCFEMAELLRRENLLTKMDGEDKDEAFVDDVVLSLLYCLNIVTKENLRPL